MSSRSRTTWRTRMGNVGHPAHPHSGSWISDPDVSVRPGRVVRGSLPLVSADQVYPHDDVPVHALPQIGPGVQRRQGDECVESIERKGVTVGRARRWAGSGIADDVEVVEPLTPDPRYAVLPRDALMEFAERHRDSIEQPVDRDPGS